MRKPSIRKIFGLLVVSCAFFTVVGFSVDRTAGLGILMVSLLLLLAIWGLFFVKTLVRSILARLTGR